MNKYFEKYTSKDVLKLLFKSFNKSTFIGEYFDEEMQSYPNNPSLASYHSILTKAGIENVGANVNFDTLKNDVQKPVLVHLNTKGGIFCILKAIDDDHVCIAQYGKDYKMKIEEFITVFSGNILIYDHEIGSLNMQKTNLISWIISRISRVILPFLFLLFLVLSYVSNSGNFTIHATVYHLLYVVGLGLSLLLFSRQLGYSNKLTDRICSGENKNVNCNSILSSKGASLFGIITWSEIGLLYFITLLMSGIVLGYENCKIIIFIASLLSFPYVFYSIIYQWKIAKIWCPLCLGVQFILIFQFVFALLIWSQGVDFTINLYDLLIVILIGLTSSAILFSLKPMFEKNIKYKYTISYLNKLKHSDSVKSNMFVKELIDTKDIDKISFFPEEQNILSFIFSPTCGHCVAKINKLIDIIETYDNIGLEFIFHTGDVMYESDKPIVRYFIEQFIQSPDNFIESLRKYATNYPISRNKLQNYKCNSEYAERIENVIRNHSHWCLKNNIIGTPVILYNNHKLSDLYTLDDIVYILSQE